MDHFQLIPTQHGLGYRVYLCRYGLSSGSPSEKGLRIDAHVSALSLSMEPVVSSFYFSRLVFSSFLWGGHLDCLGLHQETPCPVRDKADRIRTVDWWRCVHRHCGQERGQVRRPDDREHFLELGKFMSFCYQDIQFRPQAQTYVAQRSDQFFFFFS